jgi:hypothetical protein
MDSKSSMNLGGGNVSNQIVDALRQLTTFSSAVDTSLKPRLQGVLNLVTQIGHEVGKWNAGGASGAGAGASSGRVAPAPPNVGGHGGNAESTSVAPTPPGASATSGGGGGYGGYKIAAAAAAAPIARALNEAATINAGKNTQLFHQDMYTNNARSWGMGNMQNTHFIDANGNDTTYKIAPHNSVAGQNNNITNIQNTLNRKGTILDPLDTARMLATLGQTGMAGATNLNQLLIGQAQMTNILPGTSMVQSMQAARAMQQGSNVNNLRGAFGINIRGQDGSMKSVPQVVDEIWRKLTQGKKGTTAISKQDILLAAEPGNSIDSMLNQYFNNDNILRQQVLEGLMVKADTGGNIPLADVSKKTLQKLGYSTAAMNAHSNKTAQDSRNMQQIAGSAMAGYAFSENVDANLAKIADALTPLRDIASFLGGASNGIGSILKLVNNPVSSIWGMITGKATGGPVDGKTPYIVGEKGPELFVPSNDGTIIPNHDLPGGINRESGGGVSSKGASGKALALSLQKYLISAGLPANSATGIVGNLIAESGLRTTAVGDNGTSYGLAQWHAGRWENLNTFADKHKIAASSMDAQEQFLINELKNNKGLWKTLTNSKISEGDAAAAFMRKFERPLDQSDRAAAARAALGANAIAGKWDPTITPGGNSGAPTSGFSNSAYLNSWNNAGAHVANASNGGNTHNYGGVQITVNGANHSPEALANALKAMLADPNAMLGQA